jgi:hypothetical protein
MTAFLGVGSQRRLRSNRSHDVSPFMIDLDVDLLSAKVARWTL